LALLFGAFGGQLFGQEAFDFGFGGGEIGGQGRFRGVLARGGEGLALEEPLDLLSGTNETA